MANASAVHTGWHYDAQNARLDFYFRGTRVGHIDASGLTVVGSTLTAVAAVLSGGLAVAGGAGARIREGMTVSDITTAGAATYTAAQVAGGIITRDPAGAGRTDVMPDATDIIAAAAGNLDTDGQTLLCYLINTADAAEAITLGGSPTGVTYANAGQTIAQNESAILLIRRTSATAVTVYILGA